jgi:hypothetical protein
VWADPSAIDVRLDSRAATFENPTGGRGAGGSAAGGRKGSAFRTVEPGERVTLADIGGSGTVRHIWVTIPPAAPEEMRSLVLEGFYDGSAEASISVPLLDFAGCPHGRPVAYHSALTAVQEGRGFNTYFPMPFRDGLRLEVLHGGTAPVQLFYQVDYTLGPELADGTGLLHVSFRRENPTTLGRDFVICDGLTGPGRFLGCVVGVRVLDWGVWYGEGEVKVYRDGDAELPTICGTGLEDYVGSAWGMGPHHALFAGAPLEVRDTSRRRPQPEFVGFFRWHVPDPIVFRSDLRVTIQQIGYCVFREGIDDERLAAATAAGGGFQGPGPDVTAHGIAERVDDYSAAAFVYLRDPQPVPPVDVEAAAADIARLPHET